MLRGYCDKNFILFSVPSDFKDVTSQILNKVKNDGKNSKIYCQTLVKLEFFKLINFQSSKYLI